MRNLSFQIGRLPLWLVRLLDSGRYGLRFLRPVNRYPLADRVGSLSCRPLFIVSSGRAGTTLLRSMLVAGGQIAIPPEAQVIPIAIRRYLSAQPLGWYDLCRLIVALFESSHNFPLWEANLHPVYERLFNLPPAERSLARAIDEIFRCYAAQKFPQAVQWGDKSPLNTFYWRWIHRTFPQARFVHLLRDGRDAIASMVARGRRVEEATRRWKLSVEQAVELQNRLDASQFLEIRYENLVLEPVATLKQVCEFIGVEYKSRMLDFWKSPTTIEHRHYEHHRNLGKPLFTDSIGKWSQRLSPAQQQYILSQTSALLQHLGYLNAEKIGAS